MGQSFVGLTGTIKINGSNYTISSVTDATHLTLTGSAGVTWSVNWIHAGTDNVLTVGDTTGWAANDILVLGGTGRGQDGETVTIQSVDSSTQVTLTASVANPHLSASPFVAEVGNLTRNVKIRGVGSPDANKGYIYNAPAGTLNLQDTENYWLGVFATTNKYGIELEQTTGSATLSYVTARSYYNGMRSEERRVGKECRSR